jgi:hypothetical protein
MDEPNLPSDISMMSSMDSDDSLSETESIEQDSEESGSESGSDSGDDDSDSGSGDDDSGSGDESIQKTQITLEKEYNENNCSSITNKYGKICNSILKKKELVENKILKNDKQLGYPSYDDPNFNVKISSKPEFNTYKYDAKLEDIQIRDIKEYSDYLSKIPFVLSPHQHFVKNFLSPNTPYNSLLLFHGLGTGKTCSAIGIAEEERDFMKNIGLQRKIIIIATPNVQENFRQQLFNENDLTFENGFWRCSSCLGDKFIKEINPTNIKNVTKEQMVLQIKSIISNYYSFMGYGQFSSYIEMIASRAVEPGKIVQNLQKEFNSRLLIFDEIHNASEEDGDDKSIAMNLMRLVKAASVKLLLLTATPMFNSYKAIIWLINLMNINDKRSHIQLNEVFDKEGNFIPGEDSGLNLLLRKSRGYVSFIRSDNPYVFPFRIYPYIFSPEKTFPTLMNGDKEAGYQYPKYQLNGIEIEDKMNILSIYLNNIHPYQYSGYKYIIESILNRSSTKKTKFNKLIRVGDIKNMKTFNYPILQLPLESLNIIYPHEVLDGTLDSSSDSEADDSDSDSGSESGSESGSDSVGSDSSSDSENDLDVKDLSDSKESKDSSDSKDSKNSSDSKESKDSKLSDLSELKESIDSSDSKESKDLKLSDLSELKESIDSSDSNDSKDSKLSDLSELKESIDSSDLKESKDSDTRSKDLSDLSSLSDIDSVKSGGTFHSLENLFHSITKNKDKIIKVATGGAASYIDIHLLTGGEGLRRVMNFEDTDSAKGNFSYKPKYENLFAPENIGKYSCKIKNICDCIKTNDFLCEGIVLIYSQYLDAGIIPMALSLEELGFERYKGKNLLERAKPKGKLKYIMITGDKRLSPNNTLEYNAVKDKNNINGDKIKVILISSAGSEGLDFKCIRQIHIIEPWYNLNKIEQIFGRGIRNFSHKLLPFEKRNTQLFLHGTILPSEEEAVDLYIYRIAEKKAIKIGEVARILKENAVDCIINHDQINFDYKNFQDKGVKQILSNGAELDNFIVGDIPYSATCDYQKECNYDCFKSDLKMDKEPETGLFLEKKAENVIMSILRLFKENFFYKKRDLKLNYNMSEINYALSKIIDEEIIVYDKYNRPGKIVNTGEYYLFQPIELENKKISLFERSVPIDVKLKGIVFKVDTDTRKANIDERNEKEFRDLEATIDEPFTEEELGQTQEPEILREMTQNYMMTKEVADNDLSDFKNENNWYKNCGVAIQYLFSKGIEMDALYTFLIEHMVDCLFYREKIILLSYLFIAKQQNYFETKLREIFDTKIIQIKGIIAIVLYDNIERKILVLKDQRWRDASPEEKRVIEPQIKSVDNFDKYVGYIEYDVKNNVYVFKTKNTQEKGHKGARCDEKGKMKTIEILNDITDHEEFSKENTKAIKKTKTDPGRPQFVQSILCIILELYMRYYNLIEKNGKRWFCNLEEASQIKN